MNFNIYLIAKAKYSKKNTLINSLKALKLLKKPTNLSSITKDSVLSQWLTYLPSIVVN